MTDPIVFMCSGQGSQFFQMGQQLYEQHRGFRLRMEECDEVVSALLEQSLLPIIYKPLDKTREFDRLLYTNPALMSLQYSVCRVLQDMGIQPNYLIGYSLGELTAAILAGGISLAEGLHLSIELAALLEQSSPLAKILVIFEPPDIIKTVPELFEKVWLTGRNFSNNFVVTGLPEDIARVQDYLKRQNVICQLLPVNWGFHSPLLDPLQGEIKRLAERIHFKAFTIPVLSTVNGQWKLCMDAEELWRIIRQPVDFTGSVQSFMHASQEIQKENYVSSVSDSSIGVVLAKASIPVFRLEPRFQFIDLGPSGTLAAFLKQSLPTGSACRILQTVTRFGRDLECLNKINIELSN